MISVCIPTYNGEKYIVQQLESILNQLDDGDEVIISDDSSTDKTIEIIRKFHDSRIILLENCQFKSPIFNLQNALIHANGDYIFLADQDDVWLPGKVVAMIHHLQHYNIVVSDCKLIDSNGNVTADSFFDINHSGKGLIHNFIKNSYLGCCIAFRKEMLRLYLPFPVSIAMHDIWIGLLSEIFGNPIFIPDKFVLYRRHDASLTFSGKQSQYSLFYRVKYRFVFAYLVLFRLLKILLKS